MKREIYNLQIVRGIAALLVVFAHFLPQELGLYAMGQLGVSMFFFLSGYIMIYTFKEQEQPATFLQKRFLRIYPPYIIISLPLLLAAAMKTGSVSYMLHSIFLVPWFDWNRQVNSFNIHSPIANNIAWTLVFELYFYLVFSIAKKIKNTRNFVFAFTCVTILALMGVTNFINGNDGKLGWYTLTWSAVFANLCNLSFLVGMAWSMLTMQSHETKNRTWTLLLLPLSVYCITKVVPEMPVKNEQYMDVLFSCIPGWIIVASLSVSHNLKGFVFNKLHNIGQYSYSLYLFHGVLATVVYQLHPPEKYGYAISLASMVFSIWFSKYLYKYIESVRYLELFKTQRARYRNARSSTSE